MPAVNAQPLATLKAFSTQPHIGPVEQALVGIETRIASTTGPPIARHGNGLLIRSDGFVLTSAALFSKLILSPKYIVAVILHPGAPNESRLTASIVMHDGMVRRYIVGKQEPYVVLKIANLHSPALRLLLPEPLSSEHQVTLAWSRWDEASQHFQPLQKRSAELAAIKPQPTPLSRLAFAHAEDIPSSGAVVVGPDGMGVGLITSPVKSAVSTFSTFATLNTTTNCISPQSIPDTRFALMYRAVGDDGGEAAEEEVPPTAPPKVQPGNKLEASLKAPGDPPDVPLSPQARLAKSAGMVAVPGGAVQLPVVLRRYQTDMIGLHTACVVPFLIDKYEVTNAQYYQFWQSLTPHEQKLNGEMYYPVGWRPRIPPFPIDMSDVPVLGVRLSGAYGVHTDVPTSSAERRLGQGMDLMQVDARVKEMADMMYTAMQGVLCLEPGPTLKARDTFSSWVPLREEDASDLRGRYKDLVPRTLSGPVNTDFHQSQWYALWRNVAVPTHREMGRDAEMNSTVPYDPKELLNPFALYLVPGGFRCVR